VTTDAASLLTTDGNGAVGAFGVAGGFACRQSSVVSRHSFSGVVSYQSSAVTPFATARKSA